ncbi:MAG: hypothetical protein DMG96_28350 [Acidobacteria bacterium]|nr:MAG: hypothetical protein DMG96_28350 [Acidobacteriota bacterium]
MVHAWQKRNNWRTEGLLQFVGLSLPSESYVKTDPLPAFRMIFDLPSYCYDVHTRIGLTVLRRLVHGTHGAIREFFKQNRTQMAHKVLGEALFTVEGGRKKCELVYPSLSSLEQRIFAHRFGLPFDRWLDLCDLIAATVRARKIAINCTRTAAGEQSNKLTILMHYAESLQTKQTT